VGASNVGLLAPAVIVRAFPEHSSQHSPELAVSSSTGVRLTWQSRRYMRSLQLMLSMSLQSMQKTCLLSKRVTRNGPPLPDARVNARHATGAC
jgi:hypothetical protein